MTAIKNLIKAHSRAGRTNDHPILEEGLFFHDGSSILPEVLSWHKYLRSSMRQWDQITPDILELVERRMLTSSDKEERIKAHELCKELDSILHRHANQHIPEDMKSIYQTLQEVDDSAERATRTKSALQLSAEEPIQTRKGARIELLSRPLMKTSNRYADQPPVIVFGSGGPPAGESEHTRQWSYSSRPNHGEYLGLPPILEDPVATAWTQNTEYEHRGYMNNPNRTSTMGTTGEPRIGGRVTLSAPPPDPEFSHTLVKASSSISMSVRCTSWNTEEGPHIEQNVLEAHEAIQTRLSTRGRKIIPDLCLSGYYTNRNVVSGLMVL